VICYVWGSELVAHGGVLRDTRRPLTLVLTRPVGGLVMILERNVKPILGEHRVPEDLEFCRHGISSGTNSEACCDDRLHVPGIDDRKWGITAWAIKGSSDNLVPGTTFFPRPYPSLCLYLTLVPGCLSTGLPSCAYQLY